MLHNPNHYPRYRWENQPQPQQPSYFYRPEEEYYRSNLGENNQYRNSYYDDERRSRSNKPTNRYNKNPTTTNKKKKSRRSRSFSGQKQYNNHFNYNSEEEENNENEFDQYHRLNGVRSKSPPNQQHYHHNSLNRQMEEDNNRRRCLWVQQQPFVNLGAAPMINPMTFPQQSLGVCATDNTWLNPPPMTTNAFGPPTNDVIFLPQANIPMIQPPFFMQPQHNNNFLSSSFVGYYPQQQQQQPMFPTNFVQQMSTLHPDLLSSSQTNTGNSSASNNLNEKENKAAAAAEFFIPVTATATSGPILSPIINKEPNNAAPPTVDVVPAPTQKPVLLQRKKSIMKGILSSFSLLGESNNISTVNQHQQPNRQGNGGVIDSNNSSTITTTTLDPSSYTSLSEAVAKVDSMPVTDTKKVTDQQRDLVAVENNNSSGLSRKTSLKLFQKANALQNRQYIWCYRPFQPVENDQSSSDISTKEGSSAAALWAAFDIKNQIKLDNQYSLMMIKKTHQRYGLDTQPQPRQQQQHNKPPQVTTDDHILTLNKQSKLPNPVMISLHDGVAWYYNNSSMNDYSLLEIACMPTHHNRLVVSIDLMEKEGEQQQQQEYFSVPRQHKSTLRRSKSMDGLASKLLNTVLRW